jgi:hypothetical protein
MNARLQTAVRLTADCFPDEARDVVRLYALKHATGRRFSIVAVSEGFDDLEFEPAAAPVSTPAAESKESSDLESKPRPAESE